MVSEGVASTGFSFQPAKHPLSISDMFIHSKKPDGLGAGAAVNLTGDSVIHYLKAYFFSSGCTTLLGTGSIIDNGTGFAFDNEAVYLNGDSTFKLANTHVDNPTANIGCMKLIWDGGNASTDGSNCQEFTDESCSGSTCSSSQSKNVTWAASAPVCTNAPIHMFYQADDGKETHSCTLNTSNGNMVSSSCSNQVTSSGMFGLATNNGYIYIIKNASRKIEKCAIDPNTGDFESNSCVETPSTALPSPDSPRSIVLNTHFAYITTFTANNVYRCDVSLTDGALSNCAVAATGETQGLGVAINNGFLYYGSSNGDIRKCTINPTTGALSPCAENATGAGSVIGMTIHNNFMYTTTASTTVRLYSINSSNGDLTFVETTGGAFDFGTSFDIAVFNSYAYVTNIESPATITKCLVNNSTGALSDCGALSDPASAIFATGIGFY